MKIGLCGKPELLADAKAAGFAYLEPPVNGVAALSDEEFEALLAQMEAVGLPTPSFNLLFPKTLELLKPECTDAEIAAYLEKALARVQRMGGRVAVFGSGKSRNLPQGMSFEEGFRRLVQVTRLTGEVAAKYGVTIVIEPLNRAESNMINSVAEGACLVAMVDHPNVRLLADYYHMAKDNEPLTDIGRVGSLTHTHIAAKEGRLYPTVEEAGFRDFMKELKAIDYQGLLSVEGKTQDIAKDGPASIALLQRLWEEA